ncbi:MAG TPA: sulfite exporter TauE/SafE family protein [Bryobacteraceae bacterium]|nr:sulfite exporter TauE/SafE family protein [Bryobacteraceae bacterium]
MVTILEFAPVVFGISALAGCLGAMTGLGGAVIVTPALTLLMGIDIRYAIGASLVSVIATSSGAAAAYVREGYTNIRIGMFLEVATTLGAILGAYLATRVPTSWLAIIFGLVLLHAAWQSTRVYIEPSHADPGDPLGHKLKMDGEYPTPQGPVRYHAQRVKTGFAIMVGAGALSGLLGIGSGAMKVIAMDQAMRIPFKVSTTTSNFMIGVTAAASAGIYLSRGYIDPGVAMPVMLGVLSGSLLGAKILVGAKTRILRRVFALLVVAIAIEMIYSGISKKIA